MNFLQLNIQIVLTGYSKVDFVSNNKLFLFFCSYFLLLYTSPAYRIILAVPQPSLQGFYFFLSAYICIYMQNPVYVYYTLPSSAVMKLLFDLDSTCTHNS